MLDSMHKKQRMSQKSSSEDLRSGYVAVIGKPNVGKSTLVNSLLGQKIAAVSPRPQTTRRRQLGILTTTDAQIILVDTPGFHTPRHKLGQFLNQEADEALRDVDVILWMVDASQEPDDEDRQIAALLTSLRKKKSLVLGLNKIDLVDANTLEINRTRYESLVPRDSTLAFSATGGNGLNELLRVLVSLLPVRTAEFPEEQITDSYEREIAADLVREAALLHLRDEVPHCLAVRVDEYKEREERGAYIHATLFVEKESQKSIVIGAGGEMLKKIGITAREEIESMSGRKVFLELRVKLEKNWRNNERALRQLGYNIKKR